MTRRSTALPVALSAFMLGLGLFLAAPARAADDPNEVVGKAGGAEIKAGQVHDFVQRLDAAQRAQAQKDPQALLPALRSELGRLAVLNEARDKKWDQRPDVQALIEQQRNQVILSSYLQSVVQLPAGYPSDAEVQGAYESNKGNLMKAGQYHLAQIFFTVPASADKGVTDAVQRRAEEIARKARGRGSDFAALARDNSDHKESAVQGGDMGWLGAPQLLPEIRNSVAAMAKNEISQPIRTAAGYHIVKLLDTKPSEVVPLADVRESLIQTLRQRKLEELQAAYINGMLERGGVAINEMALRRAVGSVH
jgi:peptidylprolyl isomerase